MGATGRPPCRERASVSLHAHHNECTSRQGAVAGRCMARWRSHALHPPSLCSLLPLPFRAPTHLYQHKGGHGQQGQHVAGNGGTAAGRGQQLAQAHLGVLVLQVGAGWVAVWGWGEGGLAAAAAAEGQAGLSAIRYDNARHRQGRLLKHVREWRGAHRQKGNRRAQRRGTVHICSVSPRAEATHLEEDGESKEGGQPDQEDAQLAHQQAPAEALPLPVWGGEGRAQGKCSVDEAQVGGTRVCQGRHPQRRSRLFLGCRSVAALRRNATQMRRPALLPRTDHRLHRRQRKCRVGEPARLLALEQGLQG